MPEILIKPLKGKKNFERIFSSGKRFYTYCLGCTVTFCKEETRDNSIEEKSSIIYYGLIVTKKISKKAVVRNRIKRLIRESIRQSIRENAEDEFIGKIDAVLFYWKEPVKYHPKLLKLNKVLDATEELFRKVREYYKLNIINLPPPTPS